MRNTICAIAWLSLVGLVPVVVAFCPGHVGLGQQRVESCSSTSLQDGGISIGIAAAAGFLGSATGWLAREPEVQRLQKAKSTVEMEMDFQVAQTEFDEKVEGYETAMFEMDKDFEGQTEQIKAEFEAKLKVKETALEEQYKSKIVVAKQKLESEVDLKLGEQGGRLRQDFLQEKMVYESDFNSNNQENVIRSLETQSKLVEENIQLKESLDQVKADLEDIMKMQKKRFF
uniref:Uncharacterized protein n=1 Tax=Attheya septentrionalis TaxID=420275 RepID=A0A7S2U877_9STRA|mmetsp:Transcript_14666/g.26610  ORF Transcript_14666/g.26610 Transcript_14666/m.26610 type:complete len:229 (+) Transcript_14666:160-846(+)|eukprot:CAMPEP_0198295884 /NCGR_PEP_ID=MMETSP1449-20131203/30177_1 /TAXON_ID=420275 /ORGANISM="Attheya septentrionalis, Strain CCMP2084" /LENGTH=228 /DNA_ID=CAMNT_0043996319 /DNA_START=94 /DNA_END=780 /DNA_ORIENTATION=-